MSIHIKSLVILWLDGKWKHDGSLGITKDNLGKGSTYSSFVLGYKPEAQPFKCQFSPLYPNEEPTWAAQS